MTDTIAIVTPAYNERSTLEALYSRLTLALDQLAVDWHWVVVDDHSADETFEAVRLLAERDPRVRGIRLSRNCGSHAAIACGLHHIEADAAIVLASDLQDPPEIFGPLVAAWRDGAHTVWAVRQLRQGERSVSLAFASLYWWLMRSVVGLRDVPPTGSDFFLLDRRVVDALRRCPERNTSILALIAWLGFKQTSIPYDKQPRIAGRSGWTRRKKIRLVVDSLTAFTSRPLAVAGWCGATWIAGAIVSFGAAATGRGVSSMWVIPAILLTGGIQLLALAIAGAYLWRVHDEARGRPWYVVEDRVNAAEPPAVGSARS